MSGARIAWWLLVVAVVGGGVVGGYTCRRDAGRTSGGVHRPADPIGATDVAGRSVPDIDLAAELAAIANAVPPVPAGPEYVEGQRDFEIPASADCVRPTDAERAAIRTRTATWIDRGFPNEKADAKDQLEINWGCRDDAGIVIDANADRTARASEHRRIGRWWILRVTPEAITTLAEVTSTAKTDWMEWADETTVHASMLADLDGDRVRDIVWSLTAHEGGAMRSHYTFNAWRSTTRKSEQIVIAPNDDIETELVDGRFVMTFSAFDSETEQRTYRCLAASLVLEDCPAARTVQRRDAARELADKYGRKSGELPDRDQLALELEVLGVAPAARERLLAAARATTAAERMQRRVAAALATVRDPDPMFDVQQVPHPAAVAHFAEVRAALGVTPCIAGSAVSASEKARMLAAAKVMRTPGLVRESITVTRLCGGYVYVGWIANPDEEARMGGPGTYHERVQFLGASSVTELLAVEAGADWNMAQGQVGPSMVATFVMASDGTMLGLLNRFENGVVAVANGAVVGTRSGTFARHVYDGRWPEASDAVVDELDQDGTRVGSLRATAKGIEPVDLPLLQAHAKRRGAIELLEKFDPNDAAKRGAYAEALVAIGAPPALVTDVAQK